MSPPDCVCDGGKVWPERHGAGNGGINQPAPMRRHAHAVPLWRVPRNPCSRPCSSPQADDEHAGHLPRSANGRSWPSGSLAGPPSGGVWRRAGGPFAARTTAHEADGGGIRHARRPLVESRAGGVTWGQQRPRGSQWSHLPMPCGATAVTAAERLSQ